VKAKQSEVSQRRDELREWVEALLLQEVPTKSVVSSLSILLVMETQMQGDSAGVLLALLSISQTRFSGIFWTNLGSQLLVVPFPLFELPFKEGDVSVSIVNDEPLVTDVSQAANVLDKLAFK